MCMTCLQSCEGTSCLRPPLPTVKTGIQKLHINSSILPELRTACPEHCCTCHIAVALHEHKRPLSCIHALLRVSQAAYSVLLCARSATYRYAVPLPSNAASTSADTEGRTRTADSSDRLNDIQITCLCMAGVSFGCVVAALHTTRAEHGQRYTRHRQQSLQPHSTFVNGFLQVDWLLSSVRGGAWYRYALSQPGWAQYVVTTHNTDHSRR